jgi:hypothetical protein
MRRLSSSARRPGLIVAGLPRSGTSWLAKGLSFAEGYTYYREPDNHDHVPGARESFASLYLPADAGPDLEDGGYRAHMERAITGRVATAFVMSQDPGPLFRRLGRRWWRLGEKLPALWLRQPRCLVKLVHSNLALDWLATRFPQARQVYILRHPYGQFASWRRLGWSPRPEKLLESPGLVRDHLAPHLERIRAASSFWERSGAWWGAVNSVVHRQSSKRPERLVVQFEWLCQDPPAHFRALYQQLGLDWNPGVERFLARSNRGGDERPYSLRRDASRETTKWQEELTEKEALECRQAAEPFDLPYYPDFEPLPWSPLWL